jgi:hypothetical protein
MRRSIFKQHIKRDCPIILRQSSHKLHSFLDGDSKKIEANHAYKF